MVANHETIRAIEASFKDGETVEVDMTQTKVRSITPGLKILGITVEPYLIFETPDN